MIWVNAKTLKEKLIEEPHKIESILSALDCEHIKDRGKYYSATRPGGDNKQSVIVYKDSLISNCYTAGIQDVDIIGLVEKLKDLYFSHALKFICDCCEYDYYELKKEEKDSDLLKWLDIIESNKHKQNDVNLKPLNENVLNQYIKSPNIWLLNEGIDIKTQKIFEVSYDIRSERIVYPIRDEIGTLVGCKGRTTNKNVEDGYKFLSLYAYPRSQICYGLHLTLPHIKQKEEIYVFEAEKSVLKMWSMSYKNSIGIGGLIPSETQMHKILKLNCNIVFAWDSALSNENKKSINKFLEEYKILADIYVIYDKWKLTYKKDSPCDRGKEVWDELYKRRHKIN